MLERLKAALAGRYRVEREIGAGGMATVFVATDLKHQRPVAVKVLRPELAAAVGPERFLREIEIAARLQHPHILPVYDSGQVDGLLYYVMPFVEGESLRDRLVRQGPLPPVEAMRIAREAADALAYAHRQGIVHRDIKPANILLSQGHAVVADFGIARAVSASANPAGLTQAGMAVGTPSYMSPEQALGETNLDGRTDVYALGVVLYEMVTGNPPFEGTTPQAIIAQALSRSVPKLADDKLGLSPVIARALAREPTDRFATADDMGAALDTTSSMPAARPAGRRRGLIAAGLVAIAAVLAFVFWPTAAASDPRKSLIVFPFENKTGDAGRDYLEDAAMNLLGLAASHWADMRVFDDERTASLLRRRNVASGRELDFEDARDMAGEARVGTMILGDVRREGDSLAVEAKVYDVRSGDRLATHTVRAGWEADPRPLFDVLASRVLGTDGAPPGEPPSVLGQTTSSIDAYRLYLAGTAALQRFQIDSAKELLTRAVGVDTGFALAYIRLRDAEGWGTATNPERRRMYVRAAERHSARLPQRLRSIVEFHGAYEGGDFQAARRIASELIARDSTDVEAWYQLGEAHYHHRSLDYPHPDTLGNLGHALNAFERTLALDSGYVLAYQHIVDALQGCTGGAGAGAFRLCLPDSAVYGQPQGLARQYGESVPRLRLDASNREIEAARAWIKAVPGSTRPRVTLVTTLYLRGRFDEAWTEIEAVERAGWGPQVGLYKAMIAFDRGTPGLAAAIVDSTFAQMRDTLSLFSGLANFGVPAALLAGGGGRLNHARRLNAAMFRRIPVDSGNGPGGVHMSMADLAVFSDLFVQAEAGDRAGLAGAGRTIRSTIQRYVARDTALFQRLTTSWGGSSFLAFLANRDTTLLAEFLRGVDTVNSSSWRVADAHLALARGDTARARMRVDRHFRTPGPGEFAGDAGVVRSYGWGDLLARLGEPRLAIEAFSRIDTVSARLQHPGLLVRSWAERGALYQQTGDVAQAIQHYERFVEAWRDADTDRRPAVDRARNALAALKGEVRDPRRR